MTTSSLTHDEAADRADLRETAAESAAADCRAMFTGYSFLLAAGILFHQAILSDWQVVSHHLVLSLAAIWTLLRPSSLGRFLLMIAAQIAAFVIDLPFVVNHWLALAFFNVSVFACLVTLLPSLRRGEDVRAPLYERFAPLLRIQIVLLYFFAMLSKLNYGFFNPELSSAVALYGELVRKLPFLPDGDWTRQPAIWGTVLIEIALPLMLVFRRTRIAAVFAGIGFHVVMAIAGFLPFSGLAMAFLFLFLPEDMPSRLRSLLEQSQMLRDWRNRLQRAAASPLAFPALAGVWTGLALIRTEQWFPTVDVRILTIRAIQALYLLHVVVLSVLLWRCVRRPEAFRYAPHSFRLAHPVMAIIPALLVLNGLCPYLGLKTESSFTMYSNLQTEADYWNHMLLPRWLRLFDMQSELVTIYDASDPLLAASVREGNRWVFFEYQRHLSEHPEASVDFEFRGRRLQLARVADDPELAAPPPLWKRKLLWFREVAPPERNTIRH